MQVTLDDLLMAAQRLVDFLLSLGCDPDATGKHGLSFRDVNQTIGSRAKRSCGYHVDAPGRNPHEEYVFIIAEWADWREYRGFMRPLKALRPTAHF